ncbi:MAG: class I SAM-dependent methyltransferase [Cytophagaceae bacterium]|nr:class I SAM-dependent methyltransferase [Cytophagaceae bacterium]
MLKQIIGFSLRKLYLIEPLYHVKFLISQIQNKKDNNRFKHEYPHAVLPPDFILYESFGRLNYRRYYLNGKNSASYFISLFEKHISLDTKKICEWGCGPGRVIRHFPELLSSKHAEIFGTDYNKESIEWNKKNLPGINFHLNGLNPPLPFADNFFDALYSISVFTHLSEQSHYEWFSELIRVVKPGGILIISTHGDAFKEKLLPSEKKEYETKGLVIRKTQTEGKRTYAAFQSPDFMKKLIGKNTVLEHITNRDPNNKFTQDLWVVKKA